MTFSSFRYLTKQGLHNLLKNRLMTFAGIGVLTACLVLTGAATLFTANVDSIVEYLGSQNETVAYLDPLSDEATAAAAGEAIRKIDGVKSATFVSKADVLETYRGYMEEYASLWDEFESDNPFKANYRVVVYNEDLDRLAEIQEQIKAVPGIVKAPAPIDMVEIFISVQRAVTMAGYVLVSVLALVSVVVISNTIRLSVYSRRKEINIMKYVGATNGFIRWPFFIEGVGVGFLSASAAAVIVLAGYNALTVASADLTGFWQTLLGASVLPLGAVWWKILAVFFGSGIVLGGIGSVTAIRRHLNV